MHNVLLKFTFEDQEEIDYDTAESLLGCFCHNGQLIEYFHFPVIKDNTLIYNGVLIKPDALETRYYTVTARQWIQRFKEHYHITFDYEIIAQLSSRTVDNINDVQGFILYESGISPLRTLETFYNVPLYLLPPTSIDGENYHNIIAWERDYEAISRIWFRGHVDEQYFYDQLTSYKSGLSEQGMELCKLISSLTNKDCYYHLFNDPNPDVPDFENCPKCNSPWKLPNEIFDTFKYKCTNCFLIS